MKTLYNLAQKEHEKRHDKVALRVHWELNKKYDLKCGENWYEHQPLPVIENDEVKLLYCEIALSSVTDAYHRDVTVHDRTSWLGGFVF